MAKKYIFVRMPEETYAIYEDIGRRMRDDLSRIKGKPVTLPMTKVFRAVVDPKINENYIQINLKKMLVRLRK